MRRNIKATIWSAVFVLLVTGSYAQTQTIRNVAGMATIVNISPEEAKQKAIEEAKAEALRQAGAEEWVQSFDFLEKKEDSKKFDEFFHSLTAVQSMGSVIDWKLVDEDKRIDANKNLIYEVHIDATVKLYKTRPDPEFQVTINGIKPLYKNEEKMMFDIMPAREGYLKIFLLDDTRSIAALYPNVHESLLKMQARQHYTFPQNAHFNYEVYTDKKEETNYLFFVYTKNDIAYKGDDSFSKFIEYIYSMEPADRFVNVEKISIYK